MIAGADAGKTGWGLSGTDGERPENRCSSNAYKWHGPFDWKPAEDGWTRRAMVSALTLLGFDERMATDTSYEALADIVRACFTALAETFRELFSRMIINILTGNTDDHA